MKYLLFARIPPELCDAIQSYLQTIPYERIPRSGLHCTILQAEFTCEQSIIERLHTVQFHPTPLRTGIIDQFGNRLVTRIHSQELHTLHKNIVAATHDLFDPSHNAYNTAHINERYTPHITLAIGAHSTKPFPEQESVFCDYHLIRKNDRACLATYR